MSAKPVTRLSREEALPCPFCGHQPKYELYRTERGERRCAVWCGNLRCTACAPCTYGPTLKRALALWNTRKGAQA
jgi:hypothetical protein